MPLRLARTSIFAPLEYPLAEVKKLVMDLELLEDLLGVRAEPLDARDPAIRPLGPGSLRQELYIGVKDRANLDLVVLLDVWILKDTAHKFNVLL
jgi:hypothetical protein